VLDHGRPFSRRRVGGGGYVEEIGDADPQPADLPLTSEERSAYVESYHLTGDIRASISRRAYRGRARLRAPQASLSHDSPVGPMMSPLTVTVPARNPTMPRPRSGGSAGVSFAMGSP
jgi:hypothetical protein